ncbi:MAG: ABC transporter permease [Chloroflexota bacterium]|jgi:ABC-type transport system involved in multi-copper enzyme maturation permease subunit
MDVAMPVQSTTDTTSIFYWIGAMVLLVGLLFGLLYLVTGGKVLAEFRTGLSLGMRGLLAKEMRSRSRGWRPMWMLTGYLGAMAAGVAGFLLLMERAGGAISPIIGIQLFSALALGSVLMLAIITPTLTVGAISGERERRTLDLLLVTRASALGLVSGKLLGSLFYILFLLVASLPVFALVYLFGGIPLFNLGMVLAVAIVTAVTYAAIGLLLSAVLKRTIVASVITYLLVLTLVFGMPFVSTAATITSQIYRGGTPELGPPPAYLYASPLVSLTSVLPGSSAGGLQISSIASLLVFGMRSGLISGVAPTSSVATAIYITGSNPTTNQPETVTTWAPWVYNFIINATVTLVCLLLSAIAITPLKRWKRAK